MDIKQKIKELPTNSGVYIMENHNGEVIYVGKAINLKNRVSQYFQENKNHTIKVKAMVSNIADFRYIITKNEYEALALENNLIKRYQPYYNILLKDSKSYPYIKLDTKEPFPHFTITRKLKKDGAKYFGPYFAGVRPADLLETINLVYPIRTCSGFNLPKRTRPCLNYDMGLCSAPCVSKIDKNAYAEYISKAIDFLKGNDNEVRDILQQKMEKFAALEQYETAMNYRNKLRMLDRIGSHTIAFLPNTADLDVFAYASNGNTACIAVLSVRGGRSVGVECFHLLDAAVPPQQAISSLIVQYYDTVGLAPKEIIVGIDEKELADLAHYLNEQHRNSEVYGNGEIRLFNAQKGDKRKLYLMAYENALLYLDKFVEEDRRIDDMTIGAVNQLQEILQLSSRPSRIECFDISNIGGVMSVASMVVFIEGAPQKSHYRKFHIKTVKGADDFASMYEVIFRRLNDIKNKPQDPSFGVVPDLIVVDGGKGQLSNAHRAIKDCGYDIALISLAKQDEEVFVVNKSQPIVIPKTYTSLKLLQRLRDESHRFAITFHKSLRNKVSSVLDEIAGIGKVKQKILYKNFKSIDAISCASIQELENIKGITKKDAQAIFNYFNEK
ncbi:MAG: excinuclease ABC subunit UvrC [Clostridia bacterium]|nr:excinuclease ABC subunit UvrC [Clostridia bacterium]